jgi:tRNA-uridine 2-sulfurtransferase
MKKSKQERIAVAISGGVDSGVAAGLLVKEGYQCEAFYLKLLLDYPEESIKFAEKTAKKLKIPFHLVDLSILFQKEVVEKFVEAYASGLTPNPCIACNQLIKFGELFDYIRNLGFDYLATGHYVRLKKDQEGSHLLRGKDKIKDQSYFLYRLKQKQLSHILFPVGKYQKREVITMAKKWGLPVAKRPESQEICFLKGKDYRTFLKENCDSLSQGDVVNIKGQVIGKHYGLPLYTVGQRHGFSLSSEIQTPILPPYYVIGKNLKKNQLAVGFGQETEKKEFKIKDSNWLVTDYQKQFSKLNLKVRIRHQGEFLSCQLIGNKVILKRAERGITPGQSAVFYQKEEVLGGGFIVG